MERAKRNETRAALRRLDSLIPSNPLELLMVGEDLARTLGPEELKTLVKSIGNILLREIHPDTSTNQRLIGKFTVEQVLSAVDEYNQNPDRIRTEYLSSFNKKNRKDSQVSLKNAEIIPINPIESSNEIFESLYSEESVIKIKDATILLTTFSLNKQEKNQNPYHSLIIKNNKAVIKPLRYYDDDFSDSERLEIINDISKNSAIEDSTAVYATKDILTIIPGLSQEVSEIPNIFPELLKDGWWYKIIGTKRYQEENRSILSFKPLSTNQTVKLLGSIPLNIATTVAFSISQKAEANIQSQQILESNTNKRQANLKRKNFTIIPEDVWRDLLQSTSIDHNLIFKPFLLPSHVLVGETKDKSKLLLGETSFISAEYF